MMDFFRKIPADLTETTITGAALSVAACIFMGVLFIVELYAFLSTTVETGVMLDTNSDTLLRINFNVTMLDLQCDYAAVDVVDVLGTNSMNVTKNVEKWQLDEHGKRMIFQGRNREQKAISYEEHHPETVEEMMANGIHAVPLTEGGFDEYVQSHPYAFINFYAPWCRRGVRFLRFLGLKLRRRRCYGAASPRRRRRGRMTIYASRGGAAAVSRRCLCHTGASGASASNRRGRPWPRKWMRPRIWRSMSRRSTAWRTGTSVARSASRRFRPSGSSRTENSTAWIIDKIGRCRLSPHSSNKRSSSRRRWRTGADSAWQIS